MEKTQEIRAKVIDHWNQDETNTGRLLSKANRKISHGRLINSFMRKRDSSRESCEELIFEAVKVGQLIKTTRKHKANKSEIVEYISAYSCSNEQATKTASEIFKLCIGESIRYDFYYKNLLALVEVLHSIKTIQMTAGYEFKLNLSDRYELTITRES